MSICSFMFCWLGGCGGGLITRNRHAVVRPSPGRTMAEQSEQAPHPIHTQAYAHIHILSHARKCVHTRMDTTQALGLLTLPEFLPQRAHCAGDWWRGTQGL